jgi:hypothetical protein
MSAAIARMRMSDIVRPATLANTTSAAAGPKHG